MRTSFTLRSSNAMRAPYPCETGDILRLRDDASVSLLLLARGYEGGFSSYWAPASRLVLRLFEERWETSSAPAKARLAEAFANARARFAAEGPEALERLDEERGDGPACQLLAVAIDGDQAHAVWIGSDVVVVARAGAVVHRTTPHSLRATMRAQDPSLTPTMVGNIPDVNTRVIDFGMPDGPPSMATFDVRGGDVLVLLGARGDAERAAAMTAHDADAERLADRIVDAAFEPGDMACALAARLEPLG